MAGTRVRLYTATHADSVPDRSEALANAFDDAQRVNIIKKLFAFALAAVNVNLVTNDAAAVRVARRRHRTHLLALNPL